MPEASKMVLFRRRSEDNAGAKVQAARLEVDLAILEMDKVLNKVLAQTREAEEEISERRTG